MPSAQTPASSSTIQTARSNIPRIISAMERVLVIGSPGAGKSTIARKLRDALGLPLVYLDMIWHKPDGTTVTHEEFNRLLDEALRGERWIIDGNYLRTLERRLERCDTVIFLDMPVEVCLAGATARIGQPREDLPWREEELDPEFADYIRSFPTEQHPEIIQALEAWCGCRHIITLHSHAEADAFLARLAGTGANDDRRAL